MQSEPVHQTHGVHRLEAHLLMQRLCGERAKGTDKGTSTGH
jgi:hypothetical protein